MKVTIEEIEGLKETELNIKCRNITPEILMFVNDLSTTNQKVIGVDNNESFLIDPKDIYYIESVEDKVFAYTKSKMYQVNQKLYELEEKLSERFFFRASKSIIVNFSYINSLKTLFNGRMQVTMKSGEHVIISRNYVPAFKERLGVGKK